MSEIKPCPFCGNSEDLVIRGRVLSYIYCWNCGAESGLADSKDEAIEAWNQRPYDYDMPAIVKKVQRMEAAINQAITDCIPLLSWVNDDDTAVEMVEHLSEILGGALCKQPE